MRRLLHLLLLVVFALTVVAAAQQQDQTQSTPSPLVRLLQSKGIITPQEAAAINQAGSAAEQQQRLTQLLLSKGIISQDEYKETVAAVAPQRTDSGALLPAVAHVSTPNSESAVPEAAIPAAPPEGKAAAVIPAVAPVRVLQSEPAKIGGLIPDIKLGSGAKLKFYGFLKATTQYDTSNPQNLDFVLPGFGGSNGTLPQAIPTGANAGIANVPGLGNADTGPYGAPQFRVEARQSRVGANFEWPDLAGSKNAITGRLEADFEGNYSRAQNRFVSGGRTNMLSIRLAWMRIDHKISDQTSIYGLFGMDWTPFGSSTLPNILETTGVGVFFGTLYERAMQFRGGVFHDFGGSRHFGTGIDAAVVAPLFGNFSTDVAVSLGVAERQGYDSTVPETQGRVFFQWQMDKAKGVAPAQIIFSGTHARRAAVVTRAAINAAQCGNSIVANVSGTAPNQTVVIPTNTITPACTVTGNDPVTGLPVTTKVDSLLLKAFNNGAQATSDRYGVTAELQLPTRYVTFVGKVYNGEDLRFYFGNQIFSTYNSNVLGLMNAPPGTPGAKVCGRIGANPTCPTALSMDGSSTVIFGFDPVTGAPTVMPQVPVRTNGGFAQISFPLSRIFNANPEGRNAGWTLAFTYGIDTAKARDVKIASAAGGRGKSEMMVGTLFWKLNQFVTFGWETSLYRTTAYCSASSQAEAQAATGVTGTCQGTVFRGVPAREWHDFRNQFGPTFSF